MRYLLMLVGLLVLFGATMLQVPGMLSGKPMSIVAGLFCAATFGWLLALTMVMVRERKFG